MANCALLDSQAKVMNLASSNAKAATPQDLLSVSKNASKICFATPGATIQPDSPAGLMSLTSALSRPLVGFTDLRVFSPIRDIVCIANADHTCVLTHVLFTYTVEMACANVCYAYEENLRMRLYCGCRRVFVLVEYLACIFPYDFSSIFLDRQSRGPKSHQQSREPR